MPVRYYYPLEVAPLAHIPKQGGSAYGATLWFEYKGPQVTLWVGIGLAYGEFTGHNPPFTYAMRDIVIGPWDGWTLHSVQVSGTIPSDVTLRKLLDAQRFISRTRPVIGQQPPNDYGVNNWDDEVYSIAAEEVQNFSVTYW